MSCDARILHYLATLVASAVLGAAVTFMAAPVRPTTPSASDASIALSAEAGTPGDAKISYAHLVAPLVPQSREKGSR